MRSPGMASALLITSIKLLRPQGINNHLGLQIPNLDAFIGSSTKPIPVGTEDERVDDLPGIEGVKTLALIEIPEHGGSVLASRGAQRSIGGNAHSIKVSSMTDQIIAKLAVGQSPNLDETVPTARNNKRNRLRRAEPHARNPLGMTIRIRSNGVLALSQSVPELDTLITRSRNDLTVVHAECHGQHVLRVTDEPSSSTSGVNLPQPQGTIPTSTQCELSVTGNDHIRHKVRVSPQGTLGITVGIILAGRRVGETPADDGFVTRSREDEVRVFAGGGNGGDPVAVAAESASERKSFGHGLERCWVGALP
jgi:hypothetical protein